ncbi:MAG: glycosyltransferase [Bacteroidia bacterium]|nr:glycosyltransferase [Bacteroidia bacterium]
MSDLAPIVLFVYNRPWHTRQTLEALSKNHLADKSRLIIFEDGAKEGSTEEQLQSRKEVHHLIREKKWCKEVEIIERKKNFGLSNSIISGVNEIVNKYGKIIVLENDIVTSKGFLKYMNEALTLYQDKENVMYVSGFMYPVKAKLPETFFCNATSTWGWGTWNRAWKKFNSDSTFLHKALLESLRMSEFTMNDKNYLLSLLERNVAVEKKFSDAPQDIIHSKNDWCWDICWYTTLFLLNGLSLHPRQSLVRNIGHDETGAHCKESWWSQIYKNQKSADHITVDLIELINNKKANSAVENFHVSLNNPPLIVRAKEKINLLIKKK